MDTVMKLRATVNLLTRPSKHRLADPEGGPDRWVTADPLLRQLEAAVRNSTPGGSYTTSSGGKPIPISTEAFDLKGEIERTVEDHWWQTYHLHHGGGGRVLALKLRTWAMAAESDEALTRQAERICNGWVRKIKALLQPGRRWEIQGHCPECKASRVIDHQDEEGHTVTRPALSIEYQDGVPAGAVCAGCGATWRGEALARLGRHVNGASA